MAIYTACFSPENPLPRALTQHQDVKPVNNKTIFAYIGGIFQPLALINLVSDSLIANIKQFICGNLKKKFKKMKNSSNIIATIHILYYSYTIHNYILWIYTLKVYTRMCKWTN